MSLPGPSGGKPALVSCHGAPRDLGLDQGTAARARIRLEVSSARSRFASSLAHRFRPDPLTRRVERDATRHFPHMAERIDGLARGARVSRLDLVSLLAREFEPRDTASVAVSPELTSGGSLVVTALSSVEDVILRRSQPDNDYASLDLVRPWLVPPLAGINVHGLATAVIALGDGALGAGDCAAPASLLAQDCLQRFDRVDKAVEWCAGRPSGGSFALLLADAVGNLARVCVHAGSCKVDWPGDGPLLAVESDSRREALEKACATRRKLDAAGLRSALREAGATGSALVLMDPLRARLGFWVGDAGEPEWLPAAGTSTADGLD